MQYVKQDVMHLLQGNNFNTDSNCYANRMWKVGSADQSGIYDACTDPSEPETAPAAPTADASNVISVFSDAYTDIENTNFDPYWNQTTTGDWLH